MSVALSAIGEVYHARSIVRCSDAVDVNRIDDATASVADVQPDGSTSRVRMPSIGAVWAFLAVVLPIIVAVIAPTQALDLAYQIRAGERGNG